MIRRSRFELEWNKLRLSRLMHEVREANPARTNKYGKRFHQKTNKAKNGCQSVQNVFRDNGKVVVVINM